MRTALALFAVAMTAIAQTTVTPAPQIAVAAGQMGAAIGFGGFLLGGGPFPLQTIAGRPYSAEQVMEHVQTLADGTHITQTTQRTKFYRDSGGRTRTEHSFTPPPGLVTASGPPFIQIADPVAGYRYMLNSHDQTARRSAFAPMLPRPNMVAATRSAAPAVLPANAAGTTTARPHPEMSREPLGTQTIEGVVAEGTRMTTTFPEGFMGNDRPITTVTETWMSPDLKTVVLSKVSDPRSGESTTKLTNIVMAEPDPALFQVPAEYSIVDEPAPGVR
jgi:hypothetical protein